MTESHETRGSIEGDNGLFTPGPLKCPACGGRGFADGGSLWLVDVLIRLDRHGQPTIVADGGDVWLDCGRCDHQGTLCEFEPPWAEPTQRCRSSSDGYASLPKGVEPLAVSAADRVDETAWATAEFVRGRTSAPWEAR